ncbi:cysteine synthase [Aureococcus anophagefferens]|uniref:Cysteine synthase n=3 Tax=Aureococcus anophagefferens TaxID=44056 RepID=A0ABR1G0S5_AURAN
MPRILACCLATAALALVPSTAGPAGKPLGAGKVVADVSQAPSTQRSPAESPLPPKKAIAEVSEAEEDEVRRKVAASAEAAAPAVEAPFKDAAEKKWRAPAATFGFQQDAAPVLDRRKFSTLKRPLRSYEPGSIHQAHVSREYAGGTRKYAQSMDLIGNTPLVDITSVCKPKHPDTVVLGKVEFFNPGYSMKDRIMANIFNKAEEEGKLRPGMTVVAASSGNTGCSVAMMCAIRGYKAVVITNDKCSEEKKAAIRAYGADLLISPPGACYMQMETDLADENPDWFSVDQYNNLDNPNGHYRSTGPEIYEQTDGEVTHFVAAGSTGGTISGIGTYLKEKKGDDVTIVLADPTGSVFKNYFKTGTLCAPKPFLVEGVGKNNIPGAMDFAVVDALVEVGDKDALKMCAKIARSTGLCVGGSSGLNVEACARLAEQSDEPLTIVTMLCDSGVKYLSKIFNEDWLAENDISID